MYTKSGLRDRVMDDKHDPYIYTVYEGTTQLNFIRQYQQ